MAFLHHFWERCQKIDSKEEEEDGDVKISAIALKAAKKKLELKISRYFFITDGDKK